MGGCQTLTFDPEDAAAVEGAAVSYAKLGQYAKADEKLERLLTLRPNDVEAVRLLVSSGVRRAERGAARPRAASKPLAKPPARSHARTPDARRRRPRRRRVT
jgi:Flp pilus assembly protein TadD